jgi:hypothetical protein
MHEITKSSEKFVEKIAGFLPQLDFFISITSAKQAGIL